MKAIRVLLAEDHTLVRAGIRTLLEKTPEIEVVAEAGSGPEALHLVAVHQPNVVLMDIAMRGMSGLEATAQVVEQFPGTRVIIVSMHASEEYVWQALRSGATGYLLKDAGPAELELAIRTVAGGESYLSPAVSKRVADYIRRVDRYGSRERLTPRLREVLRLIAEGYTTQEIARMLHISVKTAETHRAQLMERLGIHDIAGLVRYAIRIGLVTLNE